MKKFKILIIPLLLCLPLLSIKSYAIEEKCQNTKIAAKEKFIKDNSTTNNTFILSKDGKDIEIKCGKLTYNINILPSTTSKSKLGQSTYKKTILVKQTTTLDNKLLSNENLSVKFHYDNNKAWINNDKDIEQSLEVFNKKFLNSGNTEILTTNTQCIVSSLETLYRKKTAGVHWKYYDNSHIDLICTPKGEIYYNVKPSQT